jgi:mannose-binding lectin 1
LESASGQDAPSYQGSSYQGNAAQQPIQNQPPPAKHPVASSGNTVLDAGIAAQFVDLGGRLQLTNKATNTILQDMRNQAAKSESRHAELQQNLATKSDLAALDARLQRIETLLQSVQRDLQGRDYSGSFSQLHDTLRSSHLSLTESLQGHLLSGLSPFVFESQTYID